MPQANRKKVIPRKLIMVFAIITILTGGILTVNAATDGAVLSTVEHAVQVMIDGKEADAANYTIHHETTTDENGHKVDSYKIQIPDGSGDGTDSLMSANYSVSAVATDGNFTLTPRIEVDTDEQNAIFQLEIGESDTAQDGNNQSDESTDTKPTH